MKLNKMRSKSTHSSSNGWDIPMAQKGQTRNRWNEGK